MDCKIDNYRIPRSYLLILDIWLPDSRKPS
jgi:hypothetical protein